LTEDDEEIEEADLENPDFPNFLLYGPSGHGKTSFTEDAPQPEWWDYENSTDVLPDVLRFDPNRVFHPSKARDVHSETLRLLKGIPERGNKTVIIDSITSMQDKFLLEYMRKVETESKGRRSRYEPLFQDYRMITGKMREIFYELGKAPVNVIFVAHELHVMERQDDGSEKLLQVRPELTPRVELIIRRMVSLIGYLEAEYSAMGARKTRLVVNPGYNKIVAKNRLRIKEPFLINPTWEELFAKRP